MLNFSSGAHIGDRSGFPDNEENDPGLDLGKLLRAARRQLWIIVLCCCLGLSAGIVYLWRAVPRYTATTVVVIDSAKDKSGLAATIADLTYDAGAIDSQLEVLKSEGVARAVVKNLKLDQGAMPVAPASSTFRFLRWFSPNKAVAPNASAEQIRDRLLISQLQSNLDVRRIGRSYVINVDYTSPDPVESARMSNGFAEAYIGDQVEAHFDSMRRASAFLDQSITETKKKSIDADLAIQKFKASNGILTADGKLLSDQQLAELNSQLVTAKSELARAEARYAQIRDLIGQNNIPAVVSDTLGSTTINDLRKKYLEAAATESELSNALGSDHLQAQKLRRTMFELSSLIANEMARMAAAYKSDTEVARAREQSLERSLDALAAKSGETNAVLVKLGQMQREADNYKVLYASFVQRLQQVQEQQSFLGSEAHIITPAAPPTSPSSPKRLLSMALFSLLGGFVGLGLGALREARDNVFRVASDVRDGLGMEFLGMLPLIASETNSASQKPRPFAKIMGGLQPKGRDITVLGDDRDAEPDQSNFALPYSPDEEHVRSHAIFTAESREISAQDALLNYVIHNPRTSFAETLRGTKVVIDRHLGKQPLKIVGFISLSAHEGKSTVSKNFASLLAMLGARVLLIDGDMHRSNLTHKLAEGARDGLVEVIRGERSLNEAVMFEPETGLSFLPTVVDAELVHSGQLLASAGMRSLLEQAGSLFDYVVVDLPPTGPIMDVRAAASLFDCFVLVVKWGQTLRHMVRTSIATEREIADRCVGVLYNQVQLDQIQRYESVGERSYHYQEYAQYY